jgi:hypothetical protein
MYNNEEGQRDACLEWIVNGLVVAVRRESREQGLTKSIE